MGRISKTQNDDGSRKAERYWPRELRLALAIQDRGKPKDVATHPAIEQALVQHSGLRLHRGGWC